MIEIKPLVVLLLSAMVSVALAAAAGMQPGLWEITTRMEMPGMPMQMPPQTVQHCYTKKDLDEGKSAVPRADDKSCQVKDYTLKGTTATWTMVCTGKEAMTGTGTMTWTSNSYTGNMKSKIKDGDTLEMALNWTGKRLGDCKK